MNQDYLASVEPREDEEVEMVGNGRGKRKAKEKAKQVKVMQQLLPSDEIPLLLKGPASQFSILVLVQLPAEGTSCCAVITKRQLIKSRMSSKHELQLFVILMLLFNVPLRVSGKT